MTAYNMPRSGGTMNQAPHVDLFTNIFQSSVTIIFNLLGSEFFWVCIVILMGLGRWLLLRETLLFAGKKDENLTFFEQKKKKRLLFFGRGLLGIGLPFIIVFIILSLLATKY